MKRLLIFFFCVMLLSCSTFSGLFSKSKIEVSISDEYKGFSNFIIKDIKYVKEGPLSLPDQDSVWFTKTEVPVFLQVLGDKYDLYFHPADSVPSEDTLFLKIWIHEMVQENTMPALNSITIICSIFKNERDNAGTIIYVDETAQSVLNSNYAHKVFTKILKKIAKGTK